jgi:hypothetical protein
LCCIIHCISSEGEKELVLAIIIANTRADARCGKVSIVIAQHISTPPACRHGLLARLRAIFSRKERASISWFACCHAFAPYPTLILSPLSSATGALDQRQPRNLAASKTADLSTFFHRVKTKRLAAGHDLVAGVASIIEIRSGEARSRPLRGF